MSKTSLSVETHGHYALYYVRHLTHPLMHLLLAAAVAECPQLVDHAMLLTFSETRSLLYFQVAFRLATYWWERALRITADCCQNIFARNIIRQKEPYVSLVFIFCHIR